MCRKQTGIRLLEKWVSGNICRASWKIARKVMRMVIAACWKENPEERLKPLDLLAIFSPDEKKTCDYDIS